MPKHLEQYYFKSTEETAAPAIKIDPQVDLDLPCDLTELRRKILCMSQENIALSLGISKRTWCGYELGEKDLKLRDWLALYALVRLSENPPRAREGAQSKISTIKDLEGLM